jgi:hypothetical protein
MKVGRASPAVASADGLLYVIGGDQTHEVNFYRAQITISSVECYDPLADKWHDCPPLPESRSEAGAVVVWSVVSSLSGKVRSQNQKYLNQPFGSVRMFK